jgi:AbrB family looped-hinge helix DNA binding protein
VEHTSSVSTKGQITLPADIRHRLGIKPRDRVSLALEDGVVVVRPIASGLLAGYRSVPALRTPRSLREMTDIAAEEAAEEAAREGF